MNALNVAEYTQTLGLQAKVASASMARATSATKNKALKALARLLRENTAALALDNARDLERATAAGLSAPMVDRLKLTPKVLETCAEGCEQLAAMPEPLAPSPEDRLLVIEALHRIDAMLDALPARTRTVFLLSQLEGLGYEEIAQRLEVSVRTVKRDMRAGFAQCIASML